MKKLSKKIHDFVHTVEAYCTNCSCGTCSCSSCEQSCTAACYPGAPYDHAFAQSSAGSSNYSTGSSSLNENNHSAGSYSQKMAQGGAC